jgi:hypothetical protein
MEMSDHLYIPVALTLRKISLLPTEHRDNMSFRGNIPLAVPSLTLYMILFVLFVCLCLCVCVRACMRVCVV